MHKHQLIVAGIAVLAVLGLSVLPKSIVETDIKDMRSTPAAQTVPDSNVVRMHTIPLTEAQERQLQSLRTAFASGKDRAGLTAVLDSMAALYREVNQLDSIA